MKQAKEYNNELKGLRQRYHGMDDLKMSKLRNDCSVVRRKIGALEAAVREIETDPNKNRPSKIDRKRRLPKMKLELQRLRSKHEGQRQLLEDLEQQEDMNEAARRAAVTGDITCVKRLLSRGVDINIMDSSGNSAFLYACGQGHASVAELMIKVGEANVDPDSIMSPLVLATNRCHADVVRLLLDHGATVDRRDETNRTPLLIACEKGFEDIATYLLRAGANPNAADRRGDTGLHHCAVKGNGSIAQVLIDHGVNLSIKNNDLMTALAIARSRRHFEVIDSIARK